MFEEMTFSERLQRNLRLDSWGIQKPSIEINVLIGHGNGPKNRNLQDCCFRFVQMKMRNIVTTEVQEKIAELKKEIKEKVDDLTKELEKDEKQFTTEGIYKENYSDLKKRYYEILSWRAALETLSGKELKPLDAKEFAQTTVDDAKRWNGFLNKVYEKK